MEQVRKIAGYAAPPEFVEGTILYITIWNKLYYCWNNYLELNQIAEKHDSRIVVDVNRVYYFGSAYNCELEIVLPAEMTVRESHDIALSLQHKIEELQDIERAFVHVSLLL
jgi:hypothetical protein